jgi:hypothetical protein
MLDVVVDARATVKALAAPDTAEEEKSESKQHGQDGVDIAAPREAVVLLRKHDFKCLPSNFEDVPCVNVNLGGGVLDFKFHLGSVVLFLVVATG